MVATATIPKAAAATFHFHSLLFVAGRAPVAMGSEVSLLRDSRFKSASTSLAD